MGERNLDDPERVSASWLWHQVPMKLWLILGGIILGAFSFGVKALHLTLRGNLGRTRIVLLLGGAVGGPGCRKQGQRGECLGVKSLVDSTSL